MLKVTSFSSKGRATRIASKKCNEKIIHLHSDNQLRLFLILEWSNNVTNITLNKELTDLELAVDNLDEVLLSKYRDKDTGKVYELYTNFFITVVGEKEETIAIALRMVGELEKKNVIEKLEIERRYWKFKGVKFYLITDKQIDRIFAENIMWVRETISDKSLKGKEQLADKLYYFLHNNENKSIELILQEFEVENRLNEGTALYIFRYLIAKKEISINMRKIINLKQKVIEYIKF